MTHGSRGVRRPDAAAWATWLAASVVAAFLASILVDSAIVDGLYIPRTNDSLYHARRILDAASGARGFYEFDTRLHVPDGAWVSWPWAYDYLMSRVAVLGARLDPGADPLALVFWVPVAWIFVNAALLLAICRHVGLSRGMQALAMLCFALSPLTQMLHAVGMLDHHYLEQTFVLAGAWLGMRWFADLDSRTRAVAFGAVLGLAPGFHNGLFVLQLVPLAALGILWLRRADLPRAGLQAFAIAVLAATQLVLLPSEPWRRGMFEFGLLSWFHFYVAACTAFVAAYFARTRRSPRSLAVLAIACAVLLVPLARQALGGAGFLSGSFSILANVVEAQGPFTLFTRTLGPAVTLSYYSGLLLLAPPLLAWFAYRAARETVPDRLYFACAAAFGLTLLLTQFRLHYFGSFALFVGALLAVELVRARFAWPRPATLAATLAALALAFQPSLRSRLFALYPPGSSAEYAGMLPLFHELAERCAEEPGLVLAGANDGSAVLFHTECSIIVNNFILRPADEQHLVEAGRLFRLTPRELAMQRPDVKYLLLRASDFIERDADGRAVPSTPIARELLTDAPPPPGFEPIETLRVEGGAPRALGAVYARLYRVRAEVATAPAGSR